MTGPQGDKGDKGDKGDFASLEDLGITATAEEINYSKGVTSNIQTQLTALNSRMLCGKTTVTSGVTAGENKEVQITFSTPFKTAPTVVVTANTGSSHAVAWSVGYIYTTGFKIIFTTTATVSVGFEWIAMTN